MLTALIDSGALVAYYNKGDQFHSAVREYFETYRGKLLTSEPVPTEVMWLLKSDWRVQNEFLKDVSTELFELVKLEIQNFQRIKELNEKYCDRPADFADLTIVAIGERLGILKVVSLDSDFDIYRTHSEKTFVQLFPKWE